MKHWHLVAALICFGSPASAHEVRYRIRGLVFESVLERLETATGLQFSAKCAWPEPGHAPACVINGDVEVAAGYIRLCVYEHKNADPRSVPVVVTDGLKSAIRLAILGE